MASKIRNSRAHRGTVRGNPFRRVSGGGTQRSVQDLSHYCVFTGDMGVLYPILCEDVIPGDFFRMGLTALVRDMPIVHPIMHERNIYYHCAFVPKRLLDDNFEDYYTKGVTGDYEGTLEDYTDNIPITNDGGLPRIRNDNPVNHMSSGSMWDYLGQQLTLAGVTAFTRAQRGFSINAFIKQSFNFFFNEYMRDNDYVQPVDINNGQCLYCAWEKDYFTSMARKQQRGTSPSFSLSSNPTSPVLLTGQMYPANFNNTNVGMAGAVINNTPVGGGVTVGSVNNRRDSDEFALYGLPNPTGTQTAAQVGMRSLTTQASTAGFNINDLREAIQIQLWMELNQRGGVRFTEFLKMMFDVSPRDDRLDRPEYIGGCKIPMIVSEILQTSGGMQPAGGGTTAGTINTTPQGNLAGHGIALGKNKVGNYLVKEPGYIIGFISVRPRTVYYEGVDRMYTHETTFDEVFPTFTHLSEKAVYRYELNANLGTQIGNPIQYNKKVLGFMPMYDEYRYRKNKIGGLMRNSFNTWHLARSWGDSGFDGSPYAPEINTSFICMQVNKRIYAVPTEPGLVFSIRHNIIATRPIPTLGNPGRMDHVV